MKLAKLLPWQKKIATFLPAGVKRLLPALALLLLPTVSAQIPPDSGDLLQQQQFPIAPPNLKKDSLFELQAQPVSTDNTLFFVRAIVVAGNKHLSDADMTPIIGAYQEKELSLQDLQLLCYDISQQYRQRGFLFSRAVVPQQTIKAGVLQLQVIEARLGKVITNNSSRVKTKYLDRILSQVPAGEIIKEKTLNRAILLLQDVPGIKVHTAVRAGDSLGLTNLRVAISEQPPKHHLSIHNFGSRHTHRLRLNGGMNFANLLGRGDLLAATLSTSGERMIQASINYELGIGDNSDQLGLHLNHLDYALGENLKDLNAEGQASSAAVYWHHHWLRNLGENLSTRVQLQRQDLKDQLNEGAFLTDRHVDTLALALTGDIRDYWLEGSNSSIRLGLTIGKLKFNNPEAEVRDRLSARSQGRFNRLNLDIQHRQVISPKIELLLRLSAQKARDNLDSSQKFGNTGPYAVRGYDVGGISSDSGVLLSTESQYRLNDNRYGRFALYGFVDLTRAQINHQRWDQVSGANHINLAGIGFGLRWQHRSWNGQLFAATPIGNRPGATAQSRTGQLWFQIGRHY